MKAYRSEVVKLAQSWVGLKEADGSYKKIIDIYNGYKGKLPRGLKMKYEWAWCACTWSAIAIKLGYTDVMPIEISCQNLISEAQKMGIWKEEDSYIPSPGDAILYDWDDNGAGDCTGWADHVGVVEKVNKTSGYMTVIEGNYSDSVKRRTISINGRYIRGFITPKYSKEVSTTKPPVQNGNKTTFEVAREVIAGDWGNGKDRENAITKAGYDYEDVRRIVNYILNAKNTAIMVKSASLSQPIKKRVYAGCKPKKNSKMYEGIYKTTANLYCRDDAGTNKKALCLIPKGAEVICGDGGYTEDSSGDVWLDVVCVLDGVLYEGFSHKKYLKFITS